jgi:hypothetical protein
MIYLNVSLYLFDVIKIANNSREKMRALLYKCEFNEEKKKIVNARRTRDTRKSGDQTRQS